MLLPQCSSVLSVLSLPTPPYQPSLPYQRAPRLELGADLRLLVAAPAAGDVDGVAARQQQLPRGVIAALAHLRQARQRR